MFNLYNVYNIQHFNKEKQHKGKKRQINKLRTWRKRSEKQSDIGILFMNAEK